MSQGELGDALRFIGVPERIGRPAMERYVTLKVRCGGAVERDIRDGKTPVPFTGYRIRAGQFIYSRIDARNGAFAIVPDFLDGAVVSKDFPIFEIRTDHVDSRYLLHYMRAGVLQQQIRSSSVGATNRQRIKEERLLHFGIPLPPLGEQRRIASILDQADAIRIRRYQLLAQLDALRQATFHQMFGDPLSVSATRRASIGSIATVVTGNSPPRADSANFGRSIEWIKSDNLGGEVATTADEWLSVRGRGKARVAPPGSVLVTCIAGSSASIGKASLVDRDVAFNQQINAVLPSDLLEASFLLAQFKVAPDLVRRKSTDGMKGLVNKSAFQSIEILVPPMDRQREFVARVEHIREQRIKVRRTTAAHNELFASLQARAFRGEL